MCWKVPLDLGLGGNLTCIHSWFSEKEDWNVRITKLRKQVEVIFNAKFGKLNELCYNAAAFQNSSVKRVLHFPVLI